MFGGNIMSISMANRAAYQIIGYSLVDITMRALTPFTFHDVFVFVALGE